MTDLFKSNENEFYIELKQERYYFPGDDISGDVVLDLKKPTKTNNIKVSLEGCAEIGGKSTTIYSKSLYIAEPPTGEKSYYLEAHTHRFPFKMNIPPSSELKLPSTLEIPKLLKISYRLIAVHNRPYVIVGKFCSMATETVTILEDINVEADDLKGEHTQTRELVLKGETRKVKVVVSLGKRAAVKGDIIPITVTIHHIGVMVRSKAIKIQLMRYVYYGKNKNEVFGPKVISETTSNIEISGPTSFTKSFNLKLPIPAASSCPTVDTSCSVFKIEYVIQASVNLNEENPLRREEPSDIASFNIPFIIGTYPKLSFSIDDDEEEVSESIDQNTVDTDSTNPSEYDQVFEKMKEIDLNSIPTTPVSVKQDTPPLIYQKPDEIDVPDIQTPKKGFKALTPLSRLQETPPATPTTTLSTNSNGLNAQSPTQDTFKQQSPLSTPTVRHQVTVVSPPIEKLHAIQSTSHSPSPSTNTSPQMSQSSTYSRHSSGSTASVHKQESVANMNGLERQESMRWVLPNKDTAVTVSPSVSNSSQPINSPPPLPARPSANGNNGSMPAVANNKPLPVPTSPVPPPLPSRPRPTANLSSPSSHNLPVKHNTIDSPYHHANHRPLQPSLSQPILSYSHQPQSNVPYPPQYNGTTFVSMPIPTIPDMQLQQQQQQPHNAYHNYSHNSSQQPNQPYYASHSNTTVDHGNYYQNNTTYAHNNNNVPFPQPHDPFGNAIYQQHSPTHYQPPPYYTL
ncbi:hypothetical protein CU097_003840 [Rhizopus azygosporus]|uniref:Arrestin C-terminal-like domain-containing protein n=1 Tax=Rhizopus azygosporus TaxID=86630 RepID=A0A367J5J9_RHIAZ|nr:hypothetical protein CU097_003840 [Rhizopus azygosporus]